ncbi:cobalamin biosynthesis protein CobW [Eubacterium sp. An11]|uniref:CobW family GTP-binding protein n=1 Tax=Eubacterium sp. An11 TaxID=1965542 RepID=UPI000B369004|nr:CobW family GTP-binding protein [Eubacterium sp. An11]OUQ64399.1 cobalamin biosynthesis protein CobW [Eubacterium sp. An11]
MTKIDIISGFLGAGKTTLIKKLIAEALQGQKVVLIENEFGEIGIDGGFLKESGIQINEMNSGCICCSLVGDFNAALKDVLSQYEPDRIIIEPSGVGKLSDVIKAVQKVVDGENVVLDSYITVADVKRAKMYLKNFGEFYKNQVQYASAIILSRTQDVKEDKLEKTIELIRTLNDRSPIVTTPWEDITGGQILAVMEGKNDFAEELLREAEICPECGHHHHDGEHCHHEDHDHHHEHHEDHDHCHHDDHGHDHDHCHHDDHDHHHEHHEDHDHCGHDHHHGHEGHHHADEVFTSWGKETPKKFTEEQVRGILEKLADEDSREYGIILRAKGIVPDEEGRWLHFDLVPGEEEVRYGSAEYTGRICVIGSELKEDKLMELFGL